jgi:hypothetical protein
VRSVLTLTSVGDEHPTPFVWFAHEPEIVRIEFVHCTWRVPRGVLVDGLDELATWHDLAVWPNNDGSGELTLAFTNPEETRSVVEMVTSRAGLARFVRETLLVVPRDLSRRFTLGAFLAGVGGA